MGLINFDDNFLSVLEYTSLKNTPIGLNLIFLHVKFAFLFAC
jgi:hypothetical protein